MKEKEELITKKKKGGEMCMSKMSNMGTEVVTWLASITKIKKMNINS